MSLRKTLLTLQALGALGAALPVDELNVAGENTRHIARQGYDAPSDTEELSSSVVEFSTLAKTSPTLPTHTGTAVSKQPVSTGFPTLTLPFSGFATGVYPTGAYASGTDASAHAFCTSTKVMTHDVTRTVTVTKEITVATTLNHGSPEASVKTGKSTSCSTSTLALSKGVPGVQETAFPVTLTALSSGVPRFSAAWGNSTREHSATSTRFAGSNPLATGVMSSASHVAGQMSILPTGTIITPGQETPIDESTSAPAGASPTTTENVNEEVPVTVTGSTVGNTPAGASPTPTTAGDDEEVPVTTTSAVNEESAAATPTTVDDFNEKTALTYGTESIASATGAVVSTSAASLPRVSSAPAASSSSDVALSNTVPPSGTAPSTGAASSTPVVSSSPGVSSGNGATPASSSVPSSSSAAASTDAASLSVAAASSVPASSTGVAPSTPTEGNGEATSISVSSAESTQPSVATPSETPDNGYGSPSSSVPETEVTSAPAPSNASTSPVSSPTPIPKGYEE